MANTSEFAVNLAEVQKYQPDIAAYGITDFNRRTMEKVRSL